MAISRELNEIFVNMAAHWSHKDGGNTFLSKLFDVRIRSSQIQDPIKIMLMWQQINHTSIIVGMASFFTVIFYPIVFTWHVDAIRNLCEQTSKESATQNNKDESGPPPNQ